MNTKYVFCHCLALPYNIISFHSALGNIPIYKRYKGRNVLRAELKFRKFQLNILKIIEILTNGSKAGRRGVNGNQKIKMATKHQKTSTILHHESSQSLNLNLVFPYIFK